MNNFNDRIYLLLTLKKEEILEYYLQTIGIIVALAVYNLIGMFMNTPIVISYWSILVAACIVSLIFIYLRAKVLPINWKLLDRVNEELKKGSTKPVVKEELVEEKKVEEPEEMVNETSNEEIQMVEVEEDTFDFGDSLASLYNTGTPKQLSDVAKNGIEQKVRRMNLH